MTPRMPRVIVIRHGETEWSLSGQHTGLSDIPLTARGEERTENLRKQIVGPGKLLDPAHISHVFVSPRQRAQKTFRLVFDAVEDDSKLPASWTTTDQVREWDYGVCEGLTTSGIRSKLGQSWEIYNDGCPEGDSASSMTARVDKVIVLIKSLHMAYYSHIPGSPCDDKKDGIQAESQGHLESHGNGIGESEAEEMVQNVIERAHKGQGGDVVIFSHGHFSKCFLARWADLPIKNGRAFVTGAGSVQLCGYQHHMLEETGIEGVNWYSREV